MSLQTTPWIKTKNKVKSIFQSDATHGILLVVAVVVAMIWANSPWKESYHHLWEKKLSLEFIGFEFKQSIHHLINDGLMAVFFFLVGLEIKREVMTGELSNFRKAILPIMCAIGGMLVPAAIYFAFNIDSEGASGWGIPMATDIAFTLVVLAMLGSKVPVALKIFVTALAIVDDLGAVLVIAFFYTDEIVWSSLFTAFGVFGVLLVANRIGLRNPWFYGIVGMLGIWIGFLQSGVHATIAGVLTAMAIPTSVLINEDRVSNRLVNLGKQFDEATFTGNRMVSESQVEVIEKVENTTFAAIPPLQRIEHSLEPFVNYIILPLFALANAGIALSGSIVSSLTSTVSLGIVAGLVLGKFIGIVGIARVVTWLGWAKLPTGTNWMQLMGAASLAGIGFTMSLFIAELAFTEEALLGEAKLGILIASITAAIVGVMLFLLSGDSGKSISEIKEKKQVEEAEMAVV